MSSRKNHGSQSNRRDFIKKTAVIGLSTVLGGGAVLKPKNAFSQVLTPKEPVPRRPFGRSGIDVSVLSLGGMFDIINNRLLLAKALDWGINYWDTAEGYGGGRSEEGIGRWFARNPNSRRQVFLVTKLSPRRGKNFTPRLDKCLKRLHTDYIDLLFVHGIRKIEDMEADFRLWAEKMKKEGKIRLFGFSTHTNMQACLNGAAALSWIDGIMFTYNYRLMHEPAMKTAVGACHRAGIGLTAMKTQGGGPIKKESDAEIAMAERFLQKGFTDFQAKLMAVWQDQRIASICSQMPNITLLASNAAAAVEQNRFSRADSKKLSRHADKTHDDYCAGCGRICFESLEAKIPISDVMRCLMYYHAYQDQELARATFHSMPSQKKELLKCLDFSPAEKACPRNLPIGRLMREAAARFC
jgi:predicted aldo/keto reductase-like oxidoreductase